MTHVLKCNHTAYIAVLGLHCKCLQIHSKTSLSNLSLKSYPKRDSIEEPENSQSAVWESLEAVCYHSRNWKRTKVFTNQFKIRKVCWGCVGSDCLALCQQTVEQTHSVSTRRPKVCPKTRSLSIVSSHKMANESCFAVWFLVHWHSGFLGDSRRLCFSQMPAGNAQCKEFGLSGSCYTVWL